MKVTTQNWPHCGHKFSQLQAFIGLGGVPDQRPGLVYCLTLMEEDGAELYQQDFSTLEEAIANLEERYGHWEFFDREQASSSGGCGDCSAH